MEKALGGRHNQSHLPEGPSEAAPTKHGPIVLDGVILTAPTMNAARGGGADPDSDDSWGDDEQGPQQRGGAPIKVKPRSALNQFGRDLTTAARNGQLDPVIGRDDEIERAIEILIKKTKSNPMLLGEAGVGKTAIAEGVAQRIASGEVPECLLNRRVVALDLTALIAGATYRGQFEERLNAVINESKKTGAILFIDEIHTLIGAGSVRGGMDAANILKPALARGEISCIGATTLDEYRKYFEGDDAMARRFQTVLIEPPSVDVTKSILRGLAPKYEEHHGCRYAPEALRAAAELSARYISGKHLPDKAIDVIDEAGVGYKEKVVTPERIAEVVSHMSRIPVTRITGSGGERALLLETHLNESVLGQGEACRQLAHTYVRRQAGLGDPSRPDSFLFVGGTGVGKTEMCKALAEFLYGDSDKLIFVDMSQYMDPHSVSRLIGAPPGYIGHEEGGELTNKVRRAPFSVVVLDEFEKAHPDVARIFLQVLEEGRLTDGSGRKVDFRNTTVIATSNIGTAQSSDSSGGGMGFTKVVADHNLDGAAAKANAREHFRSSVLDALPSELANRFGAVVTFDSLGYEIQQQILAKELEELNQRDGLVTQNLRIEVEPEAQAWILKRGFNRAFGARNLRRAIQDMVEVPLSHLLISDPPAAGSVIKVRLQDGQLTLHAVKGKAAGEEVVRHTPRKVGVRS